MKKFASLKVFRNIFLLILITFPISEVFCQKPLESFQNPLRQCWEIEDDSIDKIASDNELLIISNKNGEIKRIDKNTASELWKISIGSKTEPIIRINKKEIFLLTQENQDGSDKSLILRNINEQTGIVKNLTKLGKINEELNLQNIESLLIPERISQTDKLEVILDKIEQFIKKIGTSSEELIISNSNSQFVLTDGQSIFTLQLNETNQSQTIKLETDKATAIALNDESLFWGDLSGKVFKKDSANNPAKILRTGGKISSIQNVGDYLLITSNDNFLYLYSPEKQKTIWKKRLAGRVVVQPKVAESFVVVTTSAAPELTFINLENGKAFNQVILPSETFIKDFQFDERSLFILTNNSLNRFAEDCSK